MCKKKLIKSMRSKVNVKQTWEQNIQIVENWLSKRGFRLIRGNEKHVSDSVDFDLKLVLLSGRSNSENQFYSVLHECGHILNRDKNYDRKYKTLKQSEQDLRKQKTLRFLTEEIEEETEAWRRGEELAKKLKIAVDSDTYHKYASRYIMSYVVHAAKDKDYLIGK